MGGMLIGTYWFNIINIWAGAFLIYILLYFNVFQRMASYLGSMRLSRNES